jgi:hypothetical protein
VTPETTMLYDHTAAFNLLMPPNAQEVFYAERVVKQLVQYNVLPAIEALLRGVPIRMAA